MNAVKRNIMYAKLLLVLFLISCNQSNGSQIEIAKNPKANVLEKAVEIKMKTHDFTGKYLGILQGTEILMELVSDGNKLSGNLTMNGEQAKIYATSKDLTFNGKIVENDTQKTYMISGEWRQQNLHLFITFPEYNNQKAEIILKKVDKTSQNVSGQNRNLALVGTWRYTEVLSSGSGSNYMSFSTDYFVRFNSDGSFSSWTGKSAGGSGNSSIESNGGNAVVNLKWHTSGKELVLTNPNTQQSEHMNYYAESNRMMLSTGKSKRVYQRMQ